AEQVLAASVERYRQLAEALPEIVWTATAEGQLDYANSRWFQYTSLTMDGSMGDGWLAAIHPDDQAMSHERWTHSVATGEAYELEYRIRRGSDQEYRWHSARALPLHGDDGRVAKWLGTCTDIHEHKCAQEKLVHGQLELESRVADQQAVAERATELYRLLAENATDMVSTHGLDGTYDYATPSWTDYLGIPADALVGRNPGEFSHREDIPLLMANHKRAFGSVELLTTIWRCRRPDRSFGWLETATRSVRDTESQAVRAFVCTTRDITARKNAEDAVRESEAKYRQLVEQAADAILIIAPDGRCIEANARACSLLDHSVDELIGRSLGSLFTAAGGVMATRLAKLVVGEVITAEDSLARREDTHVAVEISAAKLPGGRTQIIARDISSRRELERLKAEFVSVVSHELRTPLTSIRGALGLLASGRLGDSKEKAQRMLDVAVANTDRLIRLINDILDAERIESGTIAMERAWCEDIESAGQVTEILRPVAERAGVELKVIGEQTPVWADADRLTQTLTNLVGNAIKFSPQGSTIEVRITSDDSEVRFEVRDHGRGIPADKLESIFERFQQVDASDAREKGGSGLGLAISRSIVRQHGGRIWVESTVGVGSSFCFTIPVPTTVSMTPAFTTPIVDGPADEPLVQSVEVRPHAAAARQSAGILVCDDNADFREIMREMLEGRGYAVTTAASGSEAIERAVEAPPSVILLDMVMPGMSGRETLAELRANTITRHIPVVVVSGVTPLANPARIGAAGWVEKPIDEDALMQAIERVIKPHVASAVRILLIEHDLALSRVMGSALESRGYGVEIAPTGAAALALFQAGGADAIIVDLGLPDVSGVDLLEQIQTGAGPVNVPVIVYAASDLEDVLRDRLRDSGALLAIKNCTSPDALVDEVARLIELSSSLALVAV
ncbi:MAG TPA: PAS domain S-box protein, partial [Gemmatimonadaceae bacterium]|nr:PAS domain S-box protein [Gemmatimonadaceae bacterium]